jgi:hypothetical protein
MITQQLLVEYFDYDNGELFWKKLPKCSTKTLLNTKAGCFDGRYFQVRFLGKKYRLHRLIFLYFHGYFPENIDHIDGNPLNNKIENLRECTLQQNVWNSCIRMDNTSGIKGISWNKQKNKWEVYINKDCKRYRLGYFVNIEEAKQTLEIFREKMHVDFFNNG